jgi:hypothetical protein
VVCLPWHCRICHSALSRNRAPSAKNHGEEQWRVSHVMTAVGFRPMGEFGSLADQPGHISNRAKNSQNWPAKLVIPASISPLVRGQLLPQNRRMDRTPWYRMCNLLKPASPTIPHGSYLMTETVPEVPCFFVQPALDSPDNSPITYPTHNQFCPQFRAL